MAAFFIVNLQTYKKKRVDNKKVLQKRTISNNNLYLCTQLCTISVLLQ